MNNPYGNTEIILDEADRLKLEVYKKIRSGKKSRDKIISQFYHDTSLKNAIFKFVLQSGGTKEDANSIFNVSLVKFIKTVMKNEYLEIKGSLNGYILGIAKFSWYDEFSKKNKNKVVDWEHENVELSPSPENLIINLEKKELLHDLLDRMHKNCKEVLLHWANGFTMKKIASILNYKSFKMAKKKKHQCLKQLIEYVSNNPEIKEALL